MTVVKLAVRTAQMLSPAGAPANDLGPMPAALDTLDGKVVTFWHDSTPEADVVFPMVRQYLEERGVSRVLLAKQPGPASPPLESNLEMVRQADAVVAGVAW